MAKKVTVIPAKKVQARSVKNEQGEKKIRVAAYCRVSTDQDEQLNSFENQVEYYTRYINSNPDYEMVDIYADEGVIIMHIDTIYGIAFYNRHVNIICEYLSRGVCIQVKRHQV